MFLIVVLWALWLLAVASCTPLVWYIPGVRVIASRVLERQHDVSVWS